MGESERGRRREVNQGRVGERASDVERAEGGRVGEHRGRHRGGRGGGEAVGEM